MSIELRGVTKSFGAFTAVENVSVVIPHGELVALLGPSGSGKTTLLRVVAGLEAPDRGRVLFDGEDSTDRHVRDRRVGFVFQHYALFRHMTVADNVGFGLRVRPRALRPSAAAIRARVHGLLRLVQMEALADRYPSQLSGGQRQRVALARALAIDPKVLLLDEPFCALDANVRRDLRRWLRRLHDEVGVTSVIVTHDVEEALEVADRVVVMAEGRVEQVGTPAEVYNAPATPFVYRFLGGVNLFHGRIHGSRARLSGFEVEAADLGLAHDAPVVAYVRPHEVEVDRARNGSSVAPAVVRHVRAVGPVVRVELEQGNADGIIEAELSPERHARLGLRPGDRVFVTPRAGRVFAAPVAVGSLAEPGRNKG